jgi:ABC-type transport system involved in cytochrome c biogenesis permease subunit
MDFFIFAFFSACGAVSCLILLFSMRKQQDYPMVLPLNALSMHASAFLMRERHIAEF